MRATLILLLTAGLALAAPNRRRQDDGDGTVPAADDPSTTTTVSMGLPTVTDTIVFPTMTSVPSFNTSLPVTMPPLNTTSLPPNGTVTLPPITSSAELPSSSSSMYSRSSRSRRPHTEPIPIFTSKCACEGFSFPCWAYDALNRCVYEENFSLGCYFQNKGCPSPTRSCAQIYKPTPPTGKKHPCDLSPPEETISEPFTSTSMVITAVPTLPTLSTTA